MNILFLEPYLGGSHKAFLDGFIANSRHKVTAVTMSDRHWKWRMSGGSLTLSEKVSRIPDNFDLILCSSMTNLPAFIALTNPRFAYTPSVMYMHENQLTMPLPEGEERDQTYCYINFLSALTADELLFSSMFHYKSFINELPLFLQKYSDHKHKEQIDAIREKSRVVHPGLQLKEHNSTPEYRKDNDVPVVVWNQRWEFDRNPEMFFRIMNRLDDAGCSFKLILAGDHLFEKPPEFAQIRKRYGNRIIHYGYVEDFDHYSKLLHTGDIVVSTSRYEFFCTAIMEAVYCGCHPLLPNAMTYPELIPEPLREPLLHAPVFYYSEDDLFSKMKNLLDRNTKPLPVNTLRGVNRHLDWSRQILKLDDILEEVAEQEKQKSV